MSNSKLKQNNLLRAFSISFVLLSLFAAVSLEKAKADGFDANDVINLVNIDRREQGAAELTINDKLTRAAEAKAQDMLKQNYFAHISPDGKSPWEFIMAAGYDYRYAGENLALNFTDAKEQETAWMDSSLHRKNILNPDYAEIGVAVVRGKLEEHQTTLTVQEFGSQLNYAAVQTAKNKVDTTKPVVAGASEVNKTNTAVSALNDFKTEKVFNGYFLTLAGWIWFLLVCLILVISDLILLAYKKHKYV